MIQRAEARCGQRAAHLRQVHGWLLAIADLLEPPPAAAREPAPTGAEVQARVAARLEELSTACATGAVATWLRPKVEHLVTVLHRLGAGLDPGSAGPGLPRTDNDLEQFSRRLTAQERRSTGHRRSESCVVRVGGFAAYAAASRSEPAAAVLQALAAVPAPTWQQERAILRGNQERQAKMRRFRLHRAAYLADLEARWTQLADPP